MLNRGICILTILLTMSLAVACGQAAAPSAPGKATSPGGGAPAADKAGAAPKAESGAVDAKASGNLDQLIEGARKEGALKVYILNVDEKGAQRLKDAFNKKYGLSLQIDVTSASNMPNEVAQVMTEIKTGVNASWDVMTANRMHFVAMANEGMLLPFDWLTVFPHIPPQAVMHNGGMLAYSASLQLPVYNPNLVKPDDVPNRWEDLTDPKWKGKMVTYERPSTFVRLTEAWGEDRVTSLMEGLAKQQAVIVSQLQLVSRVYSGEYPLATNSEMRPFFVEQAKGAPIAVADQVRPIVGDLFGTALPRNAQHPNAARLFMAFQLTTEAQQIWWEEARASLPLVSGPMADWTKDKEIFYPSIDFLQKNEGRLTDKYGKILGLK